MEPQRVALGIVVVGLLMSGCLEAFSDGPNSAGHTMILVLEPEGPEAYALDLPFLDSREGDGDQGGQGDVLDKMRASLQVIAGDVSFALTDNGTRIHVQGEGPAILEANRTFEGDVGEREAFLGWRLVDLHVHRISSQGPGIKVVWDVDFSGGTGHTCWASATFTADLSQGEQTAFLDGNEGVEAGQWSGRCA